MKEKKKYEDLLLRQKAEAILKSTHEHLDFDENEKDRSKLYYELEVHQIELQMQNEELMQSKKEAQELSQKYVQLYDFAPTAYFTVSHSGQIIELNLSGARMLGKDRAHLLDSNFGFHIRKEARSRYNHFFDSLYSSKIKQECELSLDHEENLNRYVQLIGQVDTSTNKCFLIAVDITERKELMSLNETLLTSLPYPAMYIRHKDKVILGANANATKLGFTVGEQCWHRFENIIQFSEEENTNSTYLLYSNDLLKCNVCLAEKCMLDGKEQSFSKLEAFGLIWDVHWVKISAEVYLHYFIDITERIHFEEALQNSELFLKQTQQIAMLGTYSLDIVSGVWIGSEILDTIFGIDKVQIKNIDSWLALIHPDWQEELKSYYLEEVITKKSNFNKEYKIIRPSDKQVRWVRELGELVFNDLQQPIKMIGTIQDISTSKMYEALITDLNETLESKVQQRTEQLEDANKELEAFSYSVSHDLRAPLRHINGFSEMLSKDTQEHLSEKGKHYLEVIAESALKMGLLIDDLLDFSRAGRLEMKKTSFLMNEVIDDARQFILASYENRQDRWEIADMPTVFADYNLIRQVWINLLDNALKYSRKRDISIIQIESELIGSEYVFSIQDNGVGFDMNYSDKLFGVFQRLHASTDFEGTGIGLANVRRIVLRHGGRTWAESELDKGAKFYFTLPKI